MMKEREKLKKQLDKVFSEYIRERDHYRCFTCGKRGAPKDGVMQCGHLFSRANLSTRWDPRNAHCQCRGCNMRHEYDWEIFRSKWVDVHGEDEYIKLYREHSTPKKFSSSDLRTMISMFTKLKGEL